MIGGFHFIFHFIFHCLFHLILHCWGGVPCHFPLPRIEGIPLCKPWHFYSWPSDTSRARSSKDPLAAVVEKEKREKEKEEKNKASKVIGTNDYIGVLYRGCIGFRG